MKKFILIYNPNNYLSYNDESESTYLDNLEYIDIYFSDGEIERYKYLINKYEDLEDIITMDLQRLLYIIENYQDSEQLKKEIETIIDAINSNRRIEEPDYTIFIVLTDEYLSFNYYEELEFSLATHIPPLLTFYEEENELVHPLETQVIISRDFRTVCIINKIDYFVAKKSKGTLFTYIIKDMTIKNEFYQFEDNMDSKIDYKDDKTIRKILNRQRGKR